MYEWRKTKVQKHSFRLFFVFFVIFHVKVLQNHKQKTEKSIVFEKFFSIRIICGDCTFEKLHTFTVFVYYFVYFSQFFCNWTHFKQNFCLFFSNGTSIFVNSWQNAVYSFTYKKVNVCIFGQIKDMFLHFVLQLNRLLQRV